MHSPDHKRTFIICSLCIVVVFCLVSMDVSGNGVQQSFYDVLPTFKRRMSQAVVCWKNGNYSRARDTFYSARELISEHMPTPMDTYGWNWSRSLKTYTIVLARLVELEVIADQNNDSMMVRMNDQVMEWADVLHQQAMEWKAVRVKNDVEEETRSIWLSRYIQAIRRVRIVCTKKEKQS